MDFGDFHLSRANVRFEFTEITSDFTRVVAFSLFNIIIEQPGASLFIRLSIRRSQNREGFFALEETDVLGSNTSDIDLLPRFPCDLRDPPSSKRSEQVVHKHYRLATRWRMLYGRCMYIENETLVAHVRRYKINKKKIRPIRHCYFKYTISSHKSDSRPENSVTLLRNFNFRLVEFLRSVIKRPGDRVKFCALQRYHFFSR